MNFRLTVLGTASAMPLPYKQPSAQVLEVHGRLFLIDCGEGTQQQILKYGISLMKLDSIYISHIHGDHVFGIFGLLSTMGMGGRTSPLHIYAPRAFSSILKFFQSFYGDGLAYSIEFHPLTNKSPELIYETKHIEILSFPLNHKIETYGYLIREKVPQFNVVKEKIFEYELSLTEIGAIKRGEDISRDGEIIPNSELAYIPYSPRSYAYCSDTAPFDEEADWVKGVDLLYHEATFLKKFEDLAIARHHSTTIQAADCAKRAGVGKLLIGHYSSRCKDIKVYEDECKSVFQNTLALKDGDIIELDLKK